MVASGTIPYSEKCPSYPHPQDGACQRALGFSIDLQQDRLSGGIMCTSEDIEHFFGNITSVLLQREFGVGIVFVIGHRGI